MPQSLAEFVSKWEASGASERANKDAFLIELCEVLDVPRPDPTTGDAEADRYVFERDARFVHEGGTTSVGKIDLYKHDCFILEAKQGSNAGAKKLGTAKRKTPAWNLAMKDAYGQAFGYAHTLDCPPPFLIVCDIGFCFDLYATFDGTLNYSAFPNAQTSRIYLRDLDKHQPLLRQIFTCPTKLDPSKQTAKVTRELAGFLADLAKRLELEGHSQELVATFLMRCVFTMFAEDVGLLPDKLFTHAIRHHWIPEPNTFADGVEQLWQTMNDGGRLLSGPIRQFNGGLFREPKGLPLDKDALHILLLAAESDWSDVEPAIFGTLLERAIDPKERHALGAHYTPRAYVERLVRPAIEEPLRADWEVVQAQIRGLVTEAEAAKTPAVQKKKLKEARHAVRSFHKELCTVRVLDPACGSGNFLYVTLDLFKRLESEVLAALESLGESQTLLHLATVRVSPEQFLGIEIKRWAKEIAEMVLWIGYLQWHLRVYGKSHPVPEPVLRDHQNIVCRDAVLAYDDRKTMTDDDGAPLTEWDGETMKTDALGNSVPDESAQVTRYTYVNPRPAEWPDADFVVGNPPFIGNKRMRTVLGEDYVEALRTVWKDVPASADLVMYWIERASRLVRSGSLRRYGLISTNSLKQRFNHRVLARHLDAENPLSIVFAVPDHPWVDSSNGAAVRVAMTVAAAGELNGVLAEIVDEKQAVEEGTLAYDVTFAEQHGRIKPELRIGASVRSAGPLRANEGLCQQGVKLVQPRDADGFVVRKADLADFGGADGRIVQPFLSNRELMQKRKDRYVIDFFGLAEDKAREAHPKAYQRVLEQVRPFRAKNREASRRKSWWLFGRSNQQMRASLQGLEKFIVTPEVAKHRIFTFVDSPLVPDASLYVVGSDDPFVLGVLSSRFHLAWCLTGGGTLEDRPRYQNGPCFDNFPFPDSSHEQRLAVAEAAVALDRHRKLRQAADPNLTLTGMYNVLTKLASDTPLSAKEKKIHDSGLVSILLKLHRELDETVARAYGWPSDLKKEEILQSLASLNYERSVAEQHGDVLWVRPEFQGDSEPKPVETRRQAPKAKVDSDVSDQKSSSAPWPKKLPWKIQAVRDLVVGSRREWSVESVATQFLRAKRSDVEAILESLSALGVLVAYDTKHGRCWRSSH